MFAWWKRRRRRRLLAEPFPADWQDCLQTHCRHYARLTPAEQQRLRNDVRLLVAEKHWEGCLGLVVTDEMRVTIAAHAALLGLGFPELPFDRLLSILIYPDTFVSRQTRAKSWGIVEEADEPRLGEAWYQGPVLLSWREVREQTQGAPSGRNVVLHEFAHLLDMENHAVDGVPAIDGPNADSWVASLHDEYHRLVRRARRGRDTVLDYYGATSEAEFFAVATEAFFERGSDLRAESPTVYQLLQEYFRQDPAARWSDLPAKVDA